MEQIQITLCFGWNKTRQRILKKDLPQSPGVPRDAIASKKIIEEWKSSNIPGMFVGCGNVCAVGIE